MKLKSLKGHPDGLKVLIAASVSGNSIVVSEEKGNFNPLFITLC